MKYSQTLGMSLHNMLKTLLIIPSSTSQKSTHYSFFILISLPIIPNVFFLFYCFVY